MYDQLPKERLLFPRQRSHCLSFVHYADSYVPGKGIHILHTFPVPHAINSVTFDLVLSRCSESSQNVPKVSYPARNRAKPILRYTQNSLINAKCQNLADCNSSRDFRHLVNNAPNNFTSSSSPPPINPDETKAFTPVSKPKILSPNFSLKVTLWMT